VIPHIKKSAELAIFFDFEWREGRREDEENTAI
jgi:hypothetical protein